MSIQIGDTLPKADLNYLQDGVKTLSTEDLCKDSKVLLFAVPGAFTPTCSARHLPSYVEKMDEFRQRGVKVACMAVNDAFVMSAWGKQSEAPADLYMLADGNAEFTKALGLELDASGFGMGLRCKRFALYAENGVVKQLWVEAPGEFKVSAADYVLSNIG
ncbi:peroxiredoxin [Pseudomarimonas arenosa]|uniref:Glutathione-dependent peroxiredoxin n=1 Tax=Pseudomarimonas arenosa TaxID=2774145 RepID=A0AAW3ZLS5_9GAMM|nr:peroxiredoxin [Pseudomarimonas arenosa]MBD8525261.1 peroxiredoxin [Pseudomarimonas arenosa]